MNTQHQVRVHAAAPIVGAVVGVVEPAPTTAAPLATAAPQLPVAHSAPMDQEKKNKLCRLTALAVVLVVLITVPASLEKVSSVEVGYAYDTVWGSLHEEQLSEGLRSIPTFGKLVLWPTRNTEVDLSCQCNSKDAIVIQIEADFLFVPITEKTLALTKRYKDWESYLEVVTLSARSSVRNSCGDFTALEFQTRRDEVQRDMTKKVGLDLESMLSATVLTLNLRNIERPWEYAEAVNARESARADIDLANEQRKQEMTKATTLELNSFLEANKTLNTASTLADVQLAFSESQYNGTMDRWATYARVLSLAQQTHNLTVKGVLAYLSNELIGSQHGTQHVAVDSPAKVSYRDEL